MTEEELLQLKPSELLSLALKDLLIAKKMPGYRINMRVFHTLSYDVCNVCLAGSIMAASLNMPKTTKTGDISYNLMQCLTAINEFREGCIVLAYSYISRYMDRRFPSVLPERIYITPYEKDEDAFVRDINTLIELLKGAGE